MHSWKDPFSAYWSNILVHCIFPNPRQRGLATLNSNSDTPVIDPPPPKGGIDQEILAFCAQKVPLQDRHERRLVYRRRGKTITLIEQRPYWKDPSLWGDCPVAQIRFDDRDQAWTLHWHDGQRRWRQYTEIPGSRTIARLLTEVDEDPMGIFWG